MIEKDKKFNIDSSRASIKHGFLRIVFVLQKKDAVVERLMLKQRNTERSVFLDFNVKQQGGKVKYFSKVKISKLLTNGFWDVVAVIRHKDNSCYEAVISGIGFLEKLWKVLVPCWKKLSDNRIAYIFVNSKREWTIQLREYDLKYDNLYFFFKEYLALVCYYLLKPYWDHKKIWLICEKFSRMAQDNGFYFFKYCMENGMQKRRKNILYVIDKNCPDYAAVREYDSNVIDFMSFKYMIYLCSAQYLISTDAIRHFYAWDSFNTVYKVLYQRRKNIIFLQHGVMGFKKCHSIFHKNGGNRMASFVVSSEWEKQIIKDWFEYMDGDIIVSGLARWDVLKDLADHSSKGPKKILLMPTFRAWIENLSKEDFCQSEFFIHYQELLNDAKFNKFLVDNNISIDFYLHPKYEQYFDVFSVRCPNINMVHFGDKALNELIMNCNLLVTDYSSISWDVFYLKKPIVFFQFDRDIYLQKQGAYLDLEKDLFGDAVFSVEELTACLKTYIKNGFREKPIYVKLRDKLLPIRDVNNCERIYKYLVSADIPKKKRNG